MTQIKNRLEDIHRFLNLLTPSDPRYPRQSVAKFSFFSLVPLVGFDQRLTSAVKKLSHRLTRMTQMKNEVENIHGFLNLLTRSDPCYPCQSVAKFLFSACAVGGI